LRITGPLSGKAVAPISQPGAAAFLSGKSPEFLLQVRPGAGHTPKHLK
jgi:hypothetical protein